MTAEGQPRFDIDALRQLAGEKVFLRGQAYHDEGQVQILVVEPDRVLAQVVGTEDYRTEVIGRGKEIGGECSCRAFDDFGFCKHMVATALAANEAVGEFGTEDGGALARIRAHLRDRGVDALADMIVDLAERDPALFRKLDMAAAAVDADDTKLETRLRKAIDDATNTRYYVDYREAYGWAADVETALDAVAGLSSGARAGLALKLAERAIDRIGEAVEHIDDSNGHCGALLTRARDIHLSAARVAGPDPVQLARSLFSREVEEDYDTFDRAAALYADVFGETGLDEYRRLATTAWEKLRLDPGGIRDRQALPGRYHRLRNILDFFAERDGDVEARIALRATDRSSPWSYLQLAEFCLAQGREEAALGWATEGLWIFEDGRPDERLVLFAADLLSRAGREVEAETHLRRAFEKAPSFELYKRLRKRGDEAVCAYAVHVLEARLAKEERGGWNSSADILVRILTHEKMFDAAWAALRKYGASVGVKNDLVRASESTHPRQALQAYAERVEQLAETGGNPAYAEAATIIARMAALRSASEQAAYVAELKQRLRRKRNFMKLLA